MGAFCRDHRSMGGSKRATPMTTDRVLPAHGAPRTSEQAGAPVASVVITTRNRWADLTRALDSVLRQDVSAEIVVMDDASSDGTRENLERRYPSVKLFRSSERLGLIAQRNRAAALARGCILFSLDDDAVLPGTSAISDVLRLFDHPRVGAVAMPIVNVIGGDRVRLGRRAPDDSTFWVTTAYLGGAHAVRRDLFLGLGGYEAALYQWGEEDNFCQKLYANGYVVRMAACADTEHFPHPVGRHGRDKNVWIYRNSVLNPWFHAPWWLAPLQIGFETFRWLARGFAKPKTLPVIVEGLARGLLFGATHPGRRRPLPTSAYWLYLQMKRKPVIALADIESRLPPVRLPDMDIIS